MGKVKGRDIVANIGRCRKHCLGLIVNKLVKLTLIGTKKLVLENLAIALPKIIPQKNVSELTYGSCY
jgi:hypothetical protein